MLTIEQFHAIQRILDSMTPFERESVKRIHHSGIGVGADSYQRVTLDAGWGQRSWDIDPEGNSALVNMGESEISMEVEAR